MVDKYKFCSTQLDLPPNLALAIRQIGSQLVDDEVLTGDGREEDPHITVRYGLHDHQPELVEQLIRAVGEPAKIKLGDLDVFRGDDADVLHIKVESPSLEKMHEALGKMRNTQTHPNYNPHITIAYLKKDAGDPLVGSHPLSGREFLLNNMSCCDRNGGKHTFKIVTDDGANRLVSKTQTIMRSSRPGKRRRYARVPDHEIHPDYQPGGVLVPTEETHDIPGAEAFPNPRQMLNRERVIPDYTPEGNMVRSSADRSLITHRIYNLAGGHAASLTPHLQEIAAGDGHSAGLAETILREGDHNALPILADALDDEGHPLANAVNWRHANRGIAIDKAIDEHIGSMPQGDFLGMPSPLAISTYGHQWMHPHTFDASQLLTQHLDSRLGGSVGQVSEDDIAHSLARLEKLKDDQELRVQHARYPGSTYQESERDPNNPNLPSLLRTARDAVDFIRRLGSGALSSYRHQLRVAEAIMAAIRSNPHMFHDTRPSEDRNVAFYGRKKKRKYNLSDGANIHPDFRTDGIASRVGRALRNVTKIFDPGHPAHAAASAILSSGPSVDAFAELHHSLAGHPAYYSYNWRAAAQKIEQDRHVHQMLGLGDAHPEDQIRTLLRHQSALASGDMDRQRQTIGHILPGAGLNTHVLRMLKHSIGRLLVRANDQVAMAHSPSHADRIERESIDPILVQRPGEKRWNSVDDNPMHYARPRGKR